MNFNKIPCGNDIPNDINVIIEISSYSVPIKYEINNKYNILFVDRFLKLPICYPYNYGFINETLSRDKDKLDSMIVTSLPILSGSVINCRPIGVLKMHDESGEDCKIISVPNHNITNEYNDINDIYDLSSNILDKILFFFKYYKKLDKKKWSNIQGWGNVMESKKIILESNKFFLNKNE